MDDLNDQRDPQDYPRISIVTPVFNHADFVRETLDSVLGQEYPNLEYILVDGASTDGTLEIINEYREELALVISEPDGGQTDAIAKGFDRATGEILAWLNSDDLLEPSALRDVATFFTNNPTACVVYGDAIWIDRAGSFLKHKREIPFNHFIWLHHYNYIPQPSTYWRRDLYDRVGGVDRSFDLAMDADLWDRFAAIATLHHVSRVWSRMRLYPEQKNQALRERSNAEDRRIRARHGISSSGVGFALKRNLARSMRVIWKAANRLRRT